MPGQQRSNRVPNFLYRCFVNKGIDSLLWISVIILLIVSLTGVIPPRKSGFYCNDEYLNKKYTGDTIGMGTLLSLSIFVPMLLMYISEVWQHGAISKNKFNRKGCSSGSRYSKHIISDFLLGSLLTLTLTDVMKDLVSEKRPHFLETCQPTVNCGTNHTYITDYKCNGGNYPKWLVQLDIYKSFPSGHASLSFFTATFMILYIQKRVSLSPSRALRPWMQLIFVFWAVVCSISRIIDNRHFWWDVLGGSIIGVLGGYLTIKSLEQNFKPRRADPEENAINEESNESTKSSAMMIIKNSNAENSVQ